MLRLKSLLLAWCHHSPASVCWSHSLDKQHIVQMADGGSFCGEDFHSQTPHKDEGGLPWSFADKVWKRMSCESWTELGLLGQAYSLYPVSIMAQLRLAAVYGHS